MAQVEFLQISAVNSDSGIQLYALDRDGQIWHNANPFPVLSPQWQKLESPDDGEEVAEGFVAQT